MVIHVKYFASLRDQVGRGEDQVNAENVSTIQEVWDLLWPNKPLPTNTLSALNKEYAELDQAVKDNDEVAFFPPVTGG